MCHLVKKNYNKDIFWDIYEKNLLIMTNFVTQVDFSTQIKSYSNTEGTLSGSANINQYVVIGTDYSDLPLGLDLTTTGITSSYGPNIYGTFSGTTGSTTFYFDDSNMDIANPYLSAITSSNSGITQNVSAFDVLTTVVEDGNSFDIYFSGVSFDVIPLNLDEYSPGLFSGVSYTYVLNYLSGTTYPWWFLKSGSTTWNEIKGRTKTDRLTVVDGAVNGYILTSDNDGNATWQPNGGGSFSGGSGNCITDLYVTNIHGCSPIHIQPLNSSGNVLIGENGGVNVGVGIDSPTQKLHISGNTRSENNNNGDVSIFVSNSNNGGNLVRGVIGSSAIADISNRVLSGLFATSGYNTDLTGSNFGDGGTGYLKNSLTITVAGANPRGDINIGTRNSNKFLRFFSGTDDFDSTSLRGSLNSSGLWGFGTNMTGQTSTIDILGTNGYDQLRLRTSYTPTTSGDTNGNIGDISWDNNYFYIKTNTGWGRINLDYSF
jgi:hypothetical protein